MTNRSLQIRGLTFRGPKRVSRVEFSDGISVVCGASDTGKSYLAESIDFMLGGSELRPIPELVEYAEIAMEIESSDGERLNLVRAISGGDFSLVDLESNESATIELKQKHAHGKTDNLSGFLLAQIGLLEKRILRSSRKGTTVSLSFRHLARLVIVQEGEIQRSGSPFWGGQYQLKTAELAAVKLLLTGIDDSSVVSINPQERVESTQRVEIFDELINEIDVELNGETEEKIDSQLDSLNKQIREQQDVMSALQVNLDEFTAERRSMHDERKRIEERIDEISEHLARFALLRRHYGIDIERLIAMRESGSIFIHVKPVACPLCGAKPEAQHLDDNCDGNIEAVVDAVSAEIEKIEQLSNELDETVTELKNESTALSAALEETSARYKNLNDEIGKALSPQFEASQNLFSELVEERASAEQVKDTFIKKRKLVDKREDLIAKSSIEERHSLAAGIPDSVAHDLSSRVEGILKAWNFPGDCRVHFDKQSSDFVIDGKPRGSRGKGLRAITHAAVTLGLYEFCQEHGLPHPGFIILDSPLLAYFKPEGDEEIALQGSDLKERFYDYLVKHHGADSQVIVIENQHPPSSIEGQIGLTVFTRNPGEGRFGLL